MALSDCGGELVHDMRSIIEDGPKSARLERDRSPLRVVFVSSMSDQDLRRRISEHGSEADRFRPAAGPASAETEIGSARLAGAVGTKEPAMPAVPAKPLCADDPTERSPTRRALRPRGIRSPRRLPMLPSGGAYEDLRLVVAGLAEAAADRFTKERVRFTNNIEACADDGRVTDLWPVRPADTPDSPDVEGGSSASFDQNTVVTEGFSRLVSGSSARSGKRPSTQSSRLSYITAEQQGSNEPGKGLLAKIVRSHRFDILVSSVVMVNLILICQDSDARADVPGRHESMDPPEWVTWGMFLCYCLFVVEFLLRLAVERRRFFETWSNRLDIFIICAGLIEYVLLWVDGDTLGFWILRLARLFRLMRLMRLIRLVAGLGELRRLAEMMGGCLRTLFWSFLLLMLMMTIWAVVAVELINPAIQDLAAKGAWPGCERCGRSFSSVFEANLTFFQTVVAGDSWGFLALPVIEAYPWMGLIFAGSLMTLVFGVLNLIVAVIVDTFAESRAKDIHQMARDLDIEEASEKKVLSRIFQKVDADGSGAISCDELVNGARRVRDFAQWLRVLDIDHNDLTELFRIVDSDDSGEIDPTEFINWLYRMKHTESKTATALIKHMVADLDHRSEAIMGEMAGSMQRLEATISKKFKFQEKTLQRVVSTDQFSTSQVELQAKLHEQERQFQTKLRQQQEAIRQQLEEALGQASQVAFQAAIEAASAKVAEVMTSVTRSGQRLTQSMSSGLLEHQKTIAALGFDSRGNQEDIVDSEKSGSCATDGGPVFCSEPSPQPEVLSCSISAELPRPPKPPAAI